jgi:protein TonB
VSLKRFFVYSIAVHILILVAAVLFIPVTKEKKAVGELFARLISPDEFLAQTPLIPSAPKVRSVPHVHPKNIMSAPVIEGIRKILPEKGNPPSLTPSTSAEKEVSSSQPLLSSPYRRPVKEEAPESKGTQQKLDKLGPSIKEKLFDKTVIGDLAKREIEKEEKEKKTFIFDTNEYRFLLYNNRLKERIESIWIYPHEASLRGIYGDLFIRFTIKKNGRLGAVELIRTSGHKSLDDAAMKALKEGEPYWPLPDEWGMEAYTIEGHFIYSIYGYYIR